MSPFDDSLTFTFIDPSRASYIVPSPTSPLAVICKSVTPRPPPYSLARPDSDAHHHPAHHRQPMQPRSIASRQPTAHSTSATATAHRPPYQLRFCTAFASLRVLSLARCFSCRLHRQRYRLAVKADPACGEAHRALAGLMMAVRGDHWAAIKGYSRAVELLGILDLGFVSHTSHVLPSFAPPRTRGAPWHYPPPRSVHHFHRRLIGACNPMLLCPFHPSRLLRTRSGSVNSPLTSF